VAFITVLSAYIGLMLVLGISLSIGVWHVVVMWRDNRLLALTLFYLTLLTVITVATVNGLRGVELGAFLCLTVMVHLAVLGVLLFYYLPLCYLILDSWIHRKRENPIDINFRAFESVRRDEIDGLDDL